MRTSSTSRACWRERDEGFIEITQATGHIKDDLAFVEKLAATAKRPILFQAITAATKNPDVHRKSLNWLQKAREKGLPIFGQARNHPQRLRLHARALEPVRHGAGVA